MEATQNIKCQGIPLQNLWLLMLYASDFRYQAHHYTGSENSDEHLVDMVADVLCTQVEKRLRRQLSFGYKHKDEQLNRVRGRINVLETERKMLLLKGKVSCRFEQLTVDTSRNQYVALALSKSIRLIENPALRNRAKMRLNDLVGLGVTVQQFCSYRPQDDRFSRHEIEDKKVIATAELMHNLALINESVGNKWLPSPEKQEHWVRRLFEKAIFGFYTLHLGDDWRVKASKKLGWQIDEMTENIPTLLPGMELDILIENVQKEQRLIIDTKFTSITQDRRFGGQSYKSNYIYQLFTYLRSQVRHDDRLSATAEGMLLHPSTGVTHRESVLIQGHRLHFCTVDLSQTSSDIKIELIGLIDKSITH